MSSTNFVGDNRFSYIQVPSGGGWHAEPHVSGHGNYMISFGTGNDIANTSDNPIAPLFELGTSPAFHNPELIKTQRLHEVPMRRVADFRPGEMELVRSQAVEDVAHSVSAALLNHPNPHTRRVAGVMMHIVGKYGAPSKGSIFTGIFPALQFAGHGIAVPT